MGKILNKLDDIRERIEDVIAKGLDTLQGIDKVDELEKQLLVKVVKAIFIGIQGCCPLSDVELYQIADVTVEKGLNKINPALSKQLKKKNKKWSKRAEAESFARNKTETPFIESERG